MAAIPLFSSFVRWSDWDGVWEICFPSYSLNSDATRIWTHVPNRYASNENLLLALTLAKREHLWDTALNATGLYLVHDDDAIELNTDDAIMDVLLRYSHL